MKKLLLLSSVALLALTSGAAAQCPGVNCTLNAVMNAPIQGITPSYSTGAVGLVAASSATTIFEICGSASKVIHVTRILFGGRATTAVSADVIINRRSSAATGGTPTTETATKYDTGSGTASATVRAFAGVPVMGTLTGIIASYQYFLGNLTTTAAGAVIDSVFGGARPSQAIVLRGAAQCAEVNLNGVTFSGNLIDVSVEWTEE